MSKKSSIIYHDLLSVVDQMPDDLAGKFVKSLLLLMQNKEIELNDFSLKMALHPFVAQFQRDNEKYKAICERNKKNGKKGGRPPSVNDIPDNPDGLIGTQTIPDNHDNDTDNDTDNDIKIENNLVEKPPVLNGGYHEVFMYWQAVHNHPRAKLDDKRKKKINALLKIGYTVDDLKTAVDGCKASPFHQGQNDRRTTFDDIELICRDASHVDRFIKTASEAGSINTLSKHGRNAVAAGKSWLEKTT